MRYLSAEEVERRLSRNDLITALELGMKDLSAGRASVPPRIAALVEDAGGLLGAMPAYVPSLNVLCAKLVSVFPRNKELPSHSAVIVAFDPANGAPMAFMDGTYITAARTAAGSALATRLLATPYASVLSVLGTGVQARAHLEAFKGYGEVLVAGRNAAKAKALAEEYGGRACSFEEACRLGDVICATTHPHEPVVRREWLRYGTHVNSVGVSADGVEVDERTVLSSRVFVESRVAATSPPPSGALELHRAVSSGALDVEEITEIGEVLLGTRQGRVADEVTLYRSVGVGVQDAAAVSVVLSNGSVQ